MSHHVSPYYIEESSGQAPALESNIAEPHLSVTEQVELRSLKSRCGGSPGGAVVESLPANAGDTGSSPGLGRSHMPRSN